MNEWVVVGIAIVGTIVVLGGGGAIIRALGGGKKNQDTKA